MYQSGAWNVATVLRATAVVVVIVLGLALE
jgi:hypothetical protein